MWQLTQFRVINCYLVREEEALTLVDTGVQGSGKGILRAARSLELPITRVTLTHAHIDHAGSLDEVSRRSPEMEVVVAHRTALFLKGDLSPERDEPRLKLRVSFVRRTTEPTMVVTHGDEVGSLRVIATPGHSPDHVAFLDVRDGTLIAGDAFQTQGGIAVAGIHRLLFPFPAMAAWRPAAALDSARKLRKLEPTRLAVGHGRVLENPLVRMDEAIAEAEEKFAGRE